MTVTDIRKRKRRGSDEMNVALISRLGKSFSL